MPALNDALLAYMNNSAASAPPQPAPRSPTPDVHVKADPTQVAMMDFLREQTDAMKEMRQQMATKDLHTKAPALQGTYTELHGDGSLFGSSPVERDVISAHVRPMGIASRIPLLPSVTENPIYATLTGYTDTTGSEAVNPCDDNPQGYVKGCNLTAQFGRVARDTQTLEMDKLMLRKNRGDFTDLVLRGRVLGLSGLSPTGLDDRDILNIATKSEMVIAGVNMERQLVRHMWQGTPANNTANGGYKEFPGLDSQIATGQVDAETNTACPALDSDVKSFGLDLVGGSGRDIVEYLSMLEYYLRFNARRMGLDPATWVVVMRPELWFELSAVWPCSYLSYRCQNSGGTNPLVINDNVNVDMRDNMRNGLYIDINGNRYDVVIDDGINELTNTTTAGIPAGQYASSIYMVPLTITGGFPVTYREHVNYQMAQRDISLLRGTEQFWSDDGIYSWAVDQNKWCYKLSLKTEQRIILRTPHLAGRIDNVRYSPLQHLRSPFPDSPYFQDGGVSVRADETLNAVWL